jgi:hypothetical protein
VTITVLTAAGTWAPPDVGYPADTARGLVNEWDTVQAEIMGQTGPAFRWAPIDYPAVGFLNPDPNTSYNESVDIGVTRGISMLLNDIPGTYDLVGYSQGAEVVIRIADTMLELGRPPRRIVTFGSPCRAPGRTKVGNNPPGSGISRFYTPTELRNRTTDIVRDKGEMYGNAEEDTLLPEFYSLFTKAELSLPFGLALFRVLGTAIPLLGLAGGGGGTLLGMFGGLFGGKSNTLPEVIGQVGAAEQEVDIMEILTDIPGVLKTAVVVGEFMTTQAHTSYHLPAPEFGGRTGIQVAIDALTH